VSKDIIPWTTDPDQVLSAWSRWTLDRNLVLRTKTGLLIFDAVECAVYDCAPHGEMEWMVLTWRVRRPEKVAPQVDFRRILISKEEVADFRFAAEIYMAENPEPLWRTVLRPKENMVVETVGSDAGNYTMYALTSVLSTSMEDHELFAIKWIYS